MFETKLRESREKMNLSQQEMADILEISVSTYNKFENGRQLPRIDVFKRICTALKVSSDWLLGIGSKSGSNVQLDSTSDILRLIFALDDNDYFVEPFQVYSEFNDYYSGIVILLHDTFQSWLVKDGFYHVDENTHNSLASKLMRYRQLKTAVFEEEFHGDFGQEVISSWQSKVLEDNSINVNRFDEKMGIKILAYFNEKTL